MRDWLTHLPYITRRSWPSAGLDFWPAGRQQVHPRLIVLHSTETTDFPGYNAGAAAPHFTLNLITGQVQQHVPLSWGSRCLAVSSGGITDRTVNVSGTIQIETIGAVTPGYPARYGHYDLPNRFPVDDRAQAHLARLLRAIHDETGIPLETSDYARWVAYPNSYGARASQRLTSAQFRDARGVVGHQHAPGNDHGDGLYGRAVNGVAVDLERVLDIAKGAGNSYSPDPPPRKPDDPNKGFTGEHLERVESLLDVLGYKGADVWARVRAYQADNGLTADGLPGPQTTSHLEATVSNVEKKLDQILAALGPDDTGGISIAKWVRRAVNAANWSGPQRTVNNLTPTLAKASGVDVDALGRVLADNLRADLVAAVGEAGSSATAEQVVDLLARRLSDGLGA